MLILEVLTLALERLALRQLKLHDILTLLHTIVSETTVKVSQNDPLDSASQKNLPGGQQDQGHGVVLHVQEKDY